MAIVKSLDILLRAKTGQLGKDLKVASNQIRSFASSVGGIAGSAFGKLAAIGGAIVGVTSLAKSVGKVNEQFEMLDRLGKVADSLGLTVSEMQSLSLAAKTAGVDMAGLESAMGAVAKIVAGSGSKKQMDMLNDIGLNQKSLQGMNGSQALAAISDAIESLGTEAQKTSAKAAIFGKSLSDLSTGSLGSDAIRKASSDIEAYGLALTRIDTANIEVANDAWAKLQMVLDGVWQKIAVQVSPAMTALIELFLESTKNAGGFSNAITAGFELMVAGIDVVARAWEFMVGVFELGKVAIIGGILYPIVEALAQIEAGLIKIGAASDMGLRAAADELYSIADDAGTNVRDRFGKAFGENGFAENFQQKMNEARSKADAVAANSAEKATKRFAPKNLIDWGSLEKMAEQMTLQMGAVGSDALSVGKRLIGIGERKMTDDREKPKAAAAVTRFSAEAQSAINSSKTPEAVIQRTHKEAQRVRERQESALKDIGRLLGSGTGVIVSLAGGGR